MAVKEKTRGEVRYFGYYLEFPDGEVWHDHTPFIHDLQFELTQMSKNPLWAKGSSVPWHLKAHDIIRKGETSWVDRNGVRHLIKIENVDRPRRWGKTRK